MNTFDELQEWYISQCNEDWEHTYGVSIGTVDNPGWSLIIDLIDTDLEDKSFEGHSYGVGDEADVSGENWLICKIENKKFVGYGGPRKLEELISVFLAWAKS